MSYSFRASHTNYTLSHILFLEINEIFHKGSIIIHSVAPIRNGSVVQPKDQKLSTS